LKRIFASAIGSAAAEEEPPAPPPAGFDGGCANDKEDVVIDAAIIATAAAATTTADLPLARLRTRTTLISHKLRMKSPRGSLDFGDGDVEVEEEPGFDVGEDGGGAEIVVGDTAAESTAGTGAGGGISRSAPEAADEIVVVALGDTFGGAVFGGSPLLPDSAKNAIAPPKIGIEITSAAHGSHAG